MLKLPQVVNQPPPQLAQAPLPLTAREVRVPQFSTAGWRRGGEGEGEPLSARVLRKARAGPAVSGHGAQAHHNAADDLPSGVAEALAARGQHTIRYLIEDPPARPAAEAEGVADAESVQQLRAQLEMSAAVIKELRTVVRVQHAKIEELRLPKELGPKAQLRLLEEFETPSQQPEEAQTVAQLEAQVRRLTNQLKELRARNADLQRVNRRYADMLGQCGRPGTQTGAPPRLSFPGRPAESATESPPSRADGDDNSPTPPPAIVGATAPDEAASPMSAGGAHSPQHRGSASKRPNFSTGPPTTDKTLAAAHRRSTCDIGFSPVAAARLANVSQLATAIWHEQEPRDVLRALLHGAGKIVDSSRCVVNLYLADPWLRSVMAEPSGGGGGAATVMKPTVFYLEGKVTVHAFRRDGLRADPPRFADLASLPILTSTTVMALPLQAAVFRPVLAVLQVTALPSGSNLRADDAASPRSGATPAEASFDSPKNDLTGVSPSQATGLQLLCSTASGILDLRRRIESVRAGQGRARECLRIAMEVHGVQSLSDFESRAKILVTRFFNVATSRICFYDAKEQELICTTMRGHHSSDQSGSATKHRLVVGRRTLARFSTREGIVGRCVRKQVVFNLERVVSSPFISESADGLDISGRGGEVNMMAGPMVAHFADGTSQVVGVLQVIEKRKRAADDPLAALERSESAAGPTVPAAPRASVVSSVASPNAGAGAAGAAFTCEAFTDEDEDFFRELLGLLGQALHRTVQALYPQGAAAEGGLARILTQC